MKFFGFLVAFLMAASASAAECKIKVTREPCPGLEAEVLKPYEGKAETEEKREYAEEADCVAWAEKSVRILRKKTLAGKKVRVTFDGKELPQTFEERKDCK